MSKQEKQQIEMEEGNLSTAEADIDSDDYDFVGLDQTTPNNSNAVVLQQQQQQQNSNGTIWNPLGMAFSVDINEMKLKMAALEAKNELLEGRLEKMELKEKIHELKEEAIGHKLKEAEEKAEMANNQLKSTIQAMQQEMANFELLAKEFKAKNNVKNNLPIHIGSKWPFECHLCEKTFIRVDTLQTHIRQMHKHANSSLKSESGLEEYNPLDETTTMATTRARLQEFLNVDDKESTGGSSLGYGINSHQPFSNDANNNSSALSPGNAIALTGEMSTFYCEWQDCQNEFPSEEAFVMHMNEVHVRAEQSPHFYCRWESCTRKEPFNAKYMLAQHIRKHCGEKPYICDHVNEDGIQCIKRYGRLENLKTHQRTHIGDRPYKCRYCEKMFSNASDCGKHQNRMHKSGKDYGCPVYKCAKQYTDPSSLRKHIFHEHGEAVWLLAKANKEANKAKDYGLIGVRLDGTPFVRRSTRNIGGGTGDGRMDEEGDSDKKVQTPNTILAQLVDMTRGGNGTTSTTTPSGSNSQQQNGQQATPSSSSTTFSEEHLKAHKSVQCGGCGDMVINQEWIMLNHVNTKHLHLPLYKCVSCNKPFENYLRSYAVRHAKFYHAGDESLLLDQREMFLGEMREAGAQLFSLNGGGKGGGDSA